MAVADGSGGLSDGLGKGIRIRCSRSTDSAFSHSRAATISGCMAARIICQRRGGRKAK